jgi:hypothetical protein
VLPYGETVIVKYQPSERSWKKVWLNTNFWIDRHRDGPAPPNWGWLPNPAKLHEGRTLKQWADDLEDVDPEVIDRSRWAVKAFGDDGVPWLLVQANKHAPGTEQRRLIAAFIHVPAAGPSYVPGAGRWRQPAIGFLHELLNDPAQPTRDAARNALKQAGDPPLVQSPF